MQCVTNKPLIWSVAILNVVMLNVVMLNGVMLSVVAPVSDDEKSFVTSRPAGTAGKLTSI